VLDFTAAGALPAWRGTDAALAVETLRENSGNRGLAHATSTGEQEGMVHPTAGKRIFQRAQHMLLAGHLAEALTLQGRAGISARPTSLDAHLYLAVRQATLEALVVAAAAALLTAVVVALFVSDRIVRPLQRIVTATRRIAAGHYAERVPGDHGAQGDEVSALAASFNTMAGALEETERRRLALIGDLAHELRTPIATIEGYLEGLLDGVITEAWFAQPSGLTVAQGKLYVADSEVSAIREIELASGRVRTLAGEDLFVFGDQDGEGEVVRLQHPLGITAGNGALYVADSYNNKIKRLDPATRRVTTWLGPGVAGEQQGAGSAASLREPGGLCAADPGLFIADTNNHRIAFADWKTGRLRIIIGAGATAGAQK